MAESPLNDQIADAVKQTSHLVLEQEKTFAKSTAYQAVIHAVSLAMNNAVAQQQQSYILRNALTTACAKAILAGNSKEAQELTNFADSTLVKGSDVATTIEDLKNILDELKSAIVSTEKTIEKKTAVKKKTATKKNSSSKKAK